MEIFAKWITITSGIIMALGSFIGSFLWVTKKSNEIAVFQYDIENRIDELEVKMSHNEAAVTGLRNEIHSLTKEISSKLDDLKEQNHGIKIDIAVIKKDLEKKI